MDNLRGALLMIGAMVCFGLEDMFVKMLTERLPAGEVLAILGLAGGAVFAIGARLSGARLLSRDIFAPTVLLRNGGEFAGTLCFVLAIALTPLALASAILQATPLVVTLGAALFLGEAVGWRRWAAILAGLAGVLIVIRPGAEGFDPLSLLAVGTVIGLSVRDVATRRVPPRVTSLQLSTWGFLSIVPGGLLMLALGGEALVAPSAGDWLRLGAGTGLGVVGYYALILATRIGDASVITPFRYTRLLVAVVIAAVVFDEPADGATLLGGAVIVASGIYTFVREMRRGRPARAARLPVESLSRPGP